MGELLSVKHLSVSIPTEKGKVQAVRDVSFSLKSGETLAIVGESGCGKSMLCKSIMKLVPEKAVFESGEILGEGKNIINLKEKELNELRGPFFSMVFQDPMTALDPTYSIGKQLAEAIRMHNRKISKKEIDSRVSELLELVGIGNSEKSKKMYPYQLSGGMRQRCVIAIALACKPKLLIADEPTTSLDVTIQAQILDLLQELKEKLKMAVILVSHDLGVVARMADRVAIMYAGKIVEIGTAEEIYHDPRHPYTCGLLKTLPALSRGKEVLYTIPGMPPSLIDLPKGDAFAIRNPEAKKIDFEKEPPMFQVSDTHFAATWLLDPEKGEQDTK